jgi:hypothetical protein
LLWPLKQFREPPAVQLGVSDRRRYRPMAEVTLDDPDVRSLVQ